MPLKAVSEPLGKPFIELQSVESTNKYAMGLIHEGMASHGTAVFTHEQTGGIGQRGKTWLSEKNANLTFSLIIDPQPLKASQLFHLIVCASVTVRKLLQDLTGEKSFIKWPNDIYVGDRKAGGILIQNVLTSGEKGVWKWAVIGIGLNVNQTQFSAELSNPISLKQITGKEYSPIELARQICTILDANFMKLKNGAFDELLNEYRNHIYKKGHEVKLKKQSRVFSATIIDITRDGKLVIKHAFEETIDFGEVEWLVT